MGKRGPCYHDPATFAQLMARTLAIDYGTKRTGLAVTDPLNIIATPLSVVATHELEGFLKNYFATCQQFPNRLTKQTHLISHFKHETTESSQYSAKHCRKMADPPQEQAPTTTTTPSTDATWSEKWTRTLQRCTKPRYLVKVLPLEKFHQITPCRTLSP